MIVSAVEFMQLIRQIATLDGIFASGAPAADGSMRNTLSAT